VALGVMNVMRELGVSRWLPKDRVSL
jgi:hypothetical protein